MTFLWGIWHILVLNHRVKTTRPFPGVVINRCTCGSDRADSEPPHLYYAAIMRKDPRA